MIKTQKNTGLPSLLLVAPLTIPALGWRLYLGQALLQFCQQVLHGLLQFLDFLTVRSVFDRLLQFC
jgi:hypothetical protein